MKRLVTLLLVLIMALSLAACGGNKDEAKDLTVAETLLKDFEERAESEDVQTIADGLLANEVIQFMGGSMSVEPGFLTGFGEYEVKGFSEGVMFSPMIGTIPFVGYVFDLEEGVDADEFIASLEENADLRWNICTEAEEMVSGKKGDKVFFVMSPKSFEQAE
ncbi:MAG: hypothetical protein IKU60_03280 [Clostridia bacterium]|nr:hypothetical protein [Clostridia bacterium]